ncbi:MAG TPA: hypothetical protein VEP66_09330 [Myxococcales bacterium]|nr:hypothetical protein [Myxococcales bacterium]
MSSRRLRLALRANLSRLVALSVLVPSAGRAWIYSEHRDIAGTGITKLRPDEREKLERLWTEARKVLPARLCERMWAGDQGPDPTCIDFAAWAAISGDHSCSPQHLVGSVVPGPWILDVAAVAAHTNLALRSAGSRVERLNRIATMNLALQRADSQYATRAGANNAHFLLARAGSNATGYLNAVVREGAPLNALGLYVQYHSAAIAAVSRLGPGASGTDVLEALALEGFALHWLEDSYAAGHVVGTWGAASWRKGTHDYYSEFGVDTLTWNGKPTVLFGDANMRPMDLERTSSAVTTSLRDLAEALTPGDQVAASARSFGPGPGAMFAFDACKEERQPTDHGLEGIAVAMSSKLESTPVPGRAEGNVNLPRFRDEIGPFLGGFASLDGGVAWGGLGETGIRGAGGVSAGVRLGLGVEGVTGTVGTGLVFVEGGIQMSAAQLDKCTGSTCDALGATNLFPRVPARTGLRLGLRLPFWLIPGDTLLLVPVLAFTSPSALSKVGVAAASGGFFPYERSINTNAGIFQFVLGREVQATLYGYLGEKSIPLIVAPVGETSSGPQYGVVAVKSLALSFPAVEWTPFRSFATQLSFSFQIQLGFGVELPLSVNTLYPTGGATPSVPLAWSVFLRLGSDGRYFTGSRDDLQPPL